MKTFSPGGADIRVDEEEKQAVAGSTRFLLGKVRVLIAPGPLANHLTMAAVKGRSTPMKIRLLRASTTAKEVEFCGKPMPPA